MALDDKYELLPSRGKHIIFLLCNWRPTKLLAIYKSSLPICGTTPFYYQLILRHVSVWLIDHLRGLFYDICSACFNLSIRIFTFIYLFIDQNHVRFNKPTGYRICHKIIKNRINTIWGMCTIDFRLIQYHNIWNNKSQ
jgi:uncharacterized membrane protein